MLLLAVALGAWGAWQYSQQTEPAQQEVKGPATPAQLEGQPVEAPAHALTSHAGSNLTLADLVGRPSLVYFAMGACADECTATLLKLAKLAADWPREINIVVVQDSAEQLADQWAKRVAPFSDAFIAVVAQIEVLAEWYQALAGPKPGATLYVLGAATQRLGTLPAEQSVAQWLGALQGWVKE